MTRTPLALASAASIERNIGGAYWFYEGETLGFRTIFAYWPQYDLLITGSVNSRPPNGEDKFGPVVIGGAFTALQQAHLIEASGVSNGEMIKDGTP